MEKLVIGCDIGGVIRDLVSEEPIEEGVLTLKDLHASNYKIVFISKCKESYAAKSKNWLSSQGLDQFLVFFCLDYEGKSEIARREKVRIMIDDKIQVLTKLDKKVFKIWLCSDDKRIEGAKKFQPDFFAEVHLARNWSEIREIIRNLKL